MLFVIDAKQTVRRAYSRVLNLRFIGDFSDQCRAYCSLPDRSHKNGLPVGDMSSLGAILSLASLLLIPWPSVREGSYPATPSLAGCCQHSIPYNEMRPAYTQPEFSDLCYLNAYG